MPEKLPSLSTLHISSPSDPPDSWDDSPSSPTDSKTPTTTTSPSESSPSQSKSYPRAPPPTPAAASPVAPSTDWSTSAARFRSIDGAFDERDEDPSPQSTEADRSEGKRKDSTRDRSKGWRDFAGSDASPTERSRGLSNGGTSRGGGDPRDFVTGAASVEKRPEKSTAVASRLIAAGLGVKAPRRTEEQREYDRAMRAQEVKRREREREEERKRKEEEEKAKRAIWDD
ncbi:Endocytosis protein end4 [Sphaceloma murrayae]|uniref:Endocytosis protein end4 n=1 Tax=Sphaceloma murrayae TaxID=2082308 RepID=A0A2K1QV97_9PEZI|nr:Endocytosis protein end4 [Sphaceloma murrayae]